jgi:molecular chaperone GrpE
MVSNENKKKNMEKNQNQDEGLNKNEETGSVEESNEVVDLKDLRIAEFEKETAGLQDKLLRKAAEFENYKRRSEADQINLIKYSAASFIIKLLPVIDDFERSLQHIEDAKDLTAIKKGLKLVYDKLIKVFDDQGVKKIDSIGKPFDVNFHEAVMQRKDDSVEPHTVLDEIEKGYLYKDRVIRHSKVIVSEESTGEPIEEPGNKINNEEKDLDKE